MIFVNFKNSLFFKFFLFLSYLTISKLHSFSEKTKNKDNFHVVEQGSIYRCKQLSPEEFKKYINKYDIKTIVNLRMELSKNKLNPEKIACEKLGVKFIHIPLHAKKMPSKKNLKAILKALEFAPKPILVHCLIGRDRTGLFCGLHFLKENELKENSLNKALDQLSFEKFGHNESKFPAMKKSLIVWSRLRKSKTKEEALKAYKPTRLT